MSEGTIVKWLRQHCHIVFVQRLRQATIESTVDFTNFNYSDIKQTLNQQSGFKSSRYIIINYSRYWISRALFAFNALSAIFKFCIIQNTHSEHSFVLVNLKDQIKSFCSKFVQFYEELYGIIRCIIIHSVDIKHTFSLGPIYTLNARRPGLQAATATNSSTHTTILS